MECNKGEAIRAKEIAEKKMENNDFEGARKIALKAQSLYPELDNITQLLSICDVHCSAQKGLLGSEKDWYGILQVEKLADELSVKKQYRRLALVLHPDKNRFAGAESAFKLICEAYAVLSDSTKKSIYDNKIRVSLRSAPVNPTSHHINKNSQLNKQYGAQNNVSNGVSSLNQHEATRSTSSVMQDVFWTCCPYCRVRYQYHKQFVNKSLVCQACSKPFITYEISALGSKSGKSGGKHVPLKPDLSQAGAFQEKVIPSQGNCKMGVQHDKGSSASHAGQQGIASRRGVRPDPGVQAGSGSKGASAAKVSGDLKAKKTDTCNTNSLHGGQECGTSNGDAINREIGDLKSRSRKRGGKVIVESSESCYTSSQSDVEDLTTKGNIGNLESDLKSEASHDHSPRRSSRKRQHVSYKETDENNLASPLKKAQTMKDDNSKMQTDAFNSEGKKHHNQSSFPTDADYSKSESKERGTVHSEESLRDRDAECDKEGKGRGESGKSGIGVVTVGNERDSNGDPFSSDNSGTDLCHCPDPEFSDFDKERDEIRFDVNQYWACYDTLDGMPRFYARVKKVCTSPFELSITWLEADPIDEAYEKWVDEELPVGCGSFKLGKTEKTSVRLSFSHKVHCEKGKKRGSLFIYPRKGEVWALFKDWDMSWSSKPVNHMEFKYEIVEVLSDFVAGTGIKVGYLDKVKGFVSLFQRVSQSETNSFLIGPNELYKLSHCVPSFKMTGSEREGVPVGSFELDPASLPLNPDNLYYPGKAKMEYRNMDPEVHLSPPKSAERRAKSVLSGGLSSPESFVDLGGTNGEISKLRRSPRGLNVTRQNAK